MNRHLRRGNRRAPRRLGSLAARPAQAALSTLVAVALAACGGGDPQMEEEVAALRTEVSQLREELVAQTTLTTAPTTSTTSTSTTSTTTTTSTTSTSTSTTTTTTSTTTTLPQTISARGSVETFWLLDLVLVDENGRATCAGVQESYQVEVRDGAGTILTLAPLESPTLIEDVDTGNFQELSCGFTYSAELPIANVFVFTLSHRSDQLSSVTMNASDLARGAPNFMVTFSCVVGGGSCQTRALGAPPR